MDQNSYFLITTAYEPSFKNDTLKNLFLGSWCFKYAENDMPQNANIVSYHWDDEKKLFLDYKKLNYLYEEILIELANLLNSFHKKNYSTRYWRIVLGPWLQYFIQIIFDRWEMINYAVNNYSIKNTISIKRPFSEIIPKDMNDFGNLYVTDEWNHQIYSRIIKEWTQIPVTEIKDNVKKNINNKKFHFNINFVKKRLLITLENLLKFFRKEDDIFLINTFLPFLQEFFLKLLLKQIPYTILEIEDFSSNHADFLARQFIDLRSKEYSGFENCIRKLIPENIPTAYLEDYNRIDDLVSNISWPNKPRAIITGVNFHYDDIFKIWAANKVENKSQFIIMQHGGNMGTVKFNSSLDHQIKVADKFITTGWKHNSNNFLNNENKLYPFGILKNILLAKFYKN
jgi:putative transferase (TIGR04331 family)